MIPKNTLYPEVIGGLGRSVPYRPARLPIRAFLDTDAARLEVDGQAATPLDLSMNGMAYLATPECPPWGVGTTHYVRLSLYGEMVYQGRARIARTESNQGRTRVGMEIIEGFIDLPKIWRRHEERNLRQALDEGPERAWRTIPPVYKLAVGHAAYFVRFWDQTLRHHERRFLEAGAAGRNSVANLAEKALHRMREPWNDIRAEAEAALQTLEKDPKLLAAAKHFTESMLTPLLLDAPAIHHAYTKPAGRSNDYQMTLYLQQNAMDGQDSFAKVFHKLLCEEPLAAALRTRSHLLRRLHHEECTRNLNSKQAKEPFRVSCLGAGTALELTELVQARPSWGRPVHWTLVDQEECALSLAHTDIYPAASSLKPPGQLRCSFMLFDQFVTAPKTVLPKKKQNLIYSADLFDYIGAPRASSIVKALYNQLQQGGLLVLGNARKPCPHRWVWEYVLDWQRELRDEAQMLDLASDLPPRAQLRVIAEKNKAYHFLLARKT